MTEQQLRKQHAQRALAEAMTAETISEKVAKADEALTILRQVELDEIMDAVDRAGMQ